MSHHASGPLRSLHKRLANAASLPADVEIAAGERATQKTAANRLIVPALT